MHDAIDPHLTAFTQMSGVKDGGAGCDEDVILHRATYDMGTRPNQTIVSNAQRMTLRTAQHGVLEHDALVAQYDRATFGYHLRAIHDPTTRPNRHITAHHSVGCNVSSRIDPRRDTRMFDEQGTSNCHLLC
jgi:hypothetical protein